MSSGKMTSSVRLALPTHPPGISKKRRGCEEDGETDRREGKRGGDRRVGSIDTLLIIMASL